MIVDRGGRWRFFWIIWSAVCNDQRDDLLSWKPFWGAKNDIPEEKPPASDASSKDSHQVACTLLSPHSKTCEARPHWCISDILPRCQLCRRHSSISLPQQGCLQHLVKESRWNRRWTQLPLLKGQTGIKGASKLSSPTLDSGCEMNAANVRVNWWSACRLKWPCPKNGQAAMKDYRPAEEPQLRLPGMLVALMRPTIGFSDKHHPPAKRISRFERRTDIIEGAWSWLISVYLHD